jgi:hypothetical protein
MSLCIKWEFHKVMRVEKKTYFINYTTSMEALADGTFQDYILPFFLYLQRLICIYMDSTKHTMMNTLSSGNSK